MSFVPNYCHIVAAARNIRPDRLSIYEHLIDSEFMELALGRRFADGKQYNCHNNRHIRRAFPPPQAFERMFTRSNFGLDYPVRFGVQVQPFFSHGKSTHRPIRLNNSRCDLAYPVVCCGQLLTVEHDAGTAKNFPARHPQDVGVGR